MEEAGQKLKRAREKLRLTFRHVEEASARIAARHDNDEFIVALSRLADIEKGTMPSIYRLYSLCVIYSLDLNEVLSWYGVSASMLPGDSDLVEHPRTHLVEFRPGDNGEVQAPLAFDPGVDLTKTIFLSRMIQRWGKLPLILFNSLELRNHRYGFIGSEDWSMFPIIPPGSLVVIDDSRRRIQGFGWTTEFDRPIYFLEHQDGYACGWCSVRGTQLTVQPHPSSLCDPETYAFPGGIEVIGQVMSVAKTLQPAGNRPRRP